jgi:hypothetical protein
MTNCEFYTKCPCHDPRSYDCTHDGDPYCGKFGEFDKAKQGFFFHLIQKLLALKEKIFG